VPTYRVAEGGVLPCGQSLRAVLGGIPVCLVRTENDEFFAVSDLCSHEETSLSDGWVDGDQIECPLHGAVFDLRSGDVVALPATEPIATYSVTVDGDDALVSIAHEDVRNTE